MLETKLQRIAMRSIKEPKEKFGKLMPLFNSENLVQCFHELNEGKAVGIDKITKEEYGINLEANIRVLIARMKTMSYRPQPVREVNIPKEGGGSRPLGISVLEDKIIQVMYAKILEAIFEPHFLDCSYGFRPKRSCHQAVKAVNDYLYAKQCPVIIDADVENYFGTINHKDLLSFLKLRIDDARFLNYLVRLLKAGILRQGKFVRSDEGSPQGAICSPVLSNIYAHYVLDLWFKEEVVPRCPGAEIVRYADDFIVCCQNISSANRILSALGKRLGRFNLQLHKSKTRLVVLNKFGTSQGVKQGTFGFLGFTFFLAKSRQGKIIPKVKTDSKKFAVKLRRVKDWLRLRRSQDLNETWKLLNRKLYGHARYYGISHNSDSVSRFIYESECLFFKWMNRRSQKRSMTWDKFNLYRKRFPGVTPQVYFRLF